MNTITTPPLAENEAALWWLGQAGYVVRSGGVTVVIDPYLSDSAAGPAGEFARAYPPPLEPEELTGDVFLVTHAHGDHLDPETIRRTRAKETAWFVAPRHTARGLRELGVPEARIAVVEASDEWTHAGLTVCGVFALPTGVDVLDTTGFLLTFANGRSVYHTSDTAFHSLVLAAAPRGVEALLVPINGKWGNLSAEQAVELTAAVGPRFVFPNHYDLMALNAENPETFRWFCRARGLAAECVIPARLTPFIWS